MKLGVSTYSFRKLVNSGQMSEMEVIEKSKELGFEGIEFSGIQVPEGEDILEYASKIREKCNNTGIEPLNYTIGADFINNDGNWEDEVERLKKEVKIADKLGVKGMRHDATTGFPADYNQARGFDDALPILIKGCQAVTEFAAEYDIKTMVENHGYFCQDSDRVEKLINGVENPNFGVLLDIGNFLCVDEDPPQAVGRLLPYVSHVHAKDFHVKPGTAPNPGQGWLTTRGGNYIRGAIVGHGNVPIIQCLKLIKQNGYDGFVSIEFEGIEDSLLGISEGRKNLQKFIEMV